MSSKAVQVSAETPLYTRKQRERRDSTVWTSVQGVLAPVQFLVFLVSLFLIGRYFFTGEGYLIAAYSVVFKTIVLLIIMITGAIWEKVVFGQYLLAPAFFWEDIVSFFVIALHLAYVLVLLGDFLSNDAKMGLALFAYGLYLLNAAQFLLKLRAARISASSIIERESEVIA
jgi:3-vinyl bacteriochlorophyllide hydratase